MRRELVGRFRFMRVLVCCAWVEGSLELWELTFVSFLGGGGAGFSVGDLGFGIGGNGNGGGGVGIGVNGDGGAGSGMSMLLVPALTESYFMANDL